MGVVVITDAGATPETPADGAALFPVAGKLKYRSESGTVHEIVTDNNAVLGSGVVTNSMLATDAKVGSLATLTTTAKTSAAAAINEVDANADAAAAAVGTLASLTTTAKSSAVVAINELDAEIGIDALSTGTDTTDIELIAADIDDSGNIVRGITSEGDNLLGRTLHQTIDAATSEWTDAITDVDGRVLSGLDGAGARVDGRATVDVHHVLSTGQSNSLGAWATPALSLTQAYGNLGFLESGMSVVGPLVEPALNALSADVETMNSAMANRISEFAIERGLQTDYRLLHSLHGVNGEPMATIKKGGAAGANAGYDLGQDQVVAAKAICRNIGVSYHVSAVTLIHGESDHINGVTNYEALLRQLQQDYSSDCRALTGQAEDVPLFLCQMSSWQCWPAAYATTSVIPQAQLDAARNNPTTIFLVCPKYMLTYVNPGHLDNVSQRRLGEYYAKAYARVVLERKAWRPLMPVSATRTAEVIRVQFNVPVAPLVLDTTTINDPGDYGFEFADSSGSTPTISSVAIVGSHEVDITLSGTPTGTKYIRYAYTATTEAASGPTTGPRGCLRDSDATPSLYGNNLYNYCVHFNMAVN